MRMGNSMMEARMANIPPQYRAMVDRMMTTTMYSNGKKSRVDTSMMTIINDVPGDKTIMINQTQHTYFVDKYDPTGAASRAPGRSPNTMPGSDEVQDVNVTDTGNTKTILGHVCHEYILTANMKSSHGGPTSVKDDMFVAKDIAGMPAHSSAYGPFAGVAGKMAGFPLLSNMTMNGGKADGATITIEVTSLSTDPLPESTFEIPAGFTQATSKADFMSGMVGGMMGGMMGGRGGAPGAGAGYP
jgi:hypothetical protein